MPIQINTNLGALSAQKEGGKANEAIKNAFARISSGLKVNTAKDDAAALSVAVDITSQIQGLSQAQRNSNDAISLSQVAEGTLSEVSDILQRARTLSVQAANGTNSAEDNRAIQAEISGLQAQLNDITQNSAFNGVDLFSGEVSLEFQTGAQAEQTVNISIDNPSESLEPIDVSTQEAAQSSISAIDAALENVTNARSDLGALQSRFESTVRNIQSQREGLAASRSRIQDADIGLETANLVKNQILSQASLAAQAQANVSKQGALALLTQAK